MSHIASQIQSLGRCFLNVGFLQVKAPSSRCHCPRESKLREDGLSAFAVWPLVFAFVVRLISDQRGARSERFHREIFQRVIDQVQVVHRSDVGLLVAENRLCPLQSCGSCHERDDQGLFVFIFEVLPNLRTLASRTDAFAPRLGGQLFLSCRNRVSNKETRLPSTIIFIFLLWNAEAVFARNPPAVAHVNPKDCCMEGRRLKLYGFFQRRKSLN